MRVKCQLVRVYGLREHRAAAPNQSPTLGQVAVNDYPENGDTLAVNVDSTIPEKISEYHKLDAASIISMADSSLAYATLQAI